MTATAPREYPRFTSLDLAVITSVSRNSQSIAQYFGASSTTLESFYFLFYLSAIELSSILTTIKKKAASPRVFPWQFGPHVPEIP